MYCQTCGASNSDDAKFCNQCGGSIARAGDVGGPKPAVGPGATAVGIGGGAPIVAPGSIGVPSGSASSGSAKPGAAVNVWEQQQTSGSGGGPSMMSVSLETIGVRSTKRVWAGIGIVALLLIALGALGSWLLRAEPEVVAEAGHAQPEDPFVIGTPLPPEAAPAPSETEVEDVQGSSAMSATMNATMSGTSASSATGSAMSGTTSGTTTMTSSGSDTSAMTGTSTMTDSTGGTGSTGSTDTSSMTGSTDTSSMTGSTDTSSMTGSTDTGSTDTPSMDTPSMDTGSTGGSTGSGSTGAPPNLGGDLPEERDLELELYGSRVRFVVQRYYAARAQTCFDRATRNNPSVSGTVVVNMTIGAEGNVSNTSTARNTTGDEVLGNCLRSQVASWQLPPPPGGSLDMQMPFSR